jgi:hypothetical protein
VAAVICDAVVCGSTANVGAFELSKIFDIAGTATYGPDIKEV